MDPDVEQAIKKGVQDFFAAYMACGQAPAECHAADFHSSRGTAVGQGTVYFQGLAARGEYFAPDLRGSYIVTESVALDDPTSAVTFSCWYDASVLLGPVDSTGRPAVLNDKIISVREKQALYFDGTDWKVGEAATMQDLGDGNQCPPPDPRPERRILSQASRFTRSARSSRCSRASASTAATRAPPTRRRSAGPST